MKQELRLPALEIRQGSNRLLYSFAVDGKLVHSFAAISRIRREDGVIAGYQRPESLAHIAGIRDYIESAAPLIPNAVVLAFDSRVRFEPLDGVKSQVAYTRPGTLIIPVISGQVDQDKPGFIVDGQQRLAAIRDADIELVPQFPICVTAFITDEVKEQTEQFILVNSTKPLNKGLIYELLPNTEAVLPGLLQRRRFPSFVLDRLNRDEDSPFVRMIQTPTNPTTSEKDSHKGIVNQTAILKMIEHTTTDGMFRFNASNYTSEEVEQVLTVVKVYWSAVRTVFNEAWGLPPRKSRLMHGAGIVSMGMLMEEIAHRNRANGLPSYEQFVEALSAIKDDCRWTDGYWEFGFNDHSKWNDIQNTSKDIQKLATHLRRLYSAKVPPIRSTIRA